MRTVEAHKGWVWQSSKRASWQFESSVNPSTSEPSLNTSSASPSTLNDWTLWTLYTGTAYTAFLQVLFYCHSNEAVIFFLWSYGKKNCHSSSKLKQYSHNDMLQCPHIKKGVLMVFLVQKLYFFFFF